MRKFFVVGALLIPLLVAACANPPPITGNIVNDVANSVVPATPITGPGGTTAPTDNIVAQGLINAAFDLDSAVQVGALSPTDPAPACVHSILLQAGLENPAGASVTPQSFVPKISDAISAAAVLYIRAQQVAALTNGGLTPSPTCDQLIGSIVREAVTQFNKTTIGTITGGLLSTKSPAKKPTH